MSDPLDRPIRPGKIYGNRTRDLLYVRQQFLKAQTLAEMALHQYTADLSMETVLSVNQVLWALRKVRLSVKEQETTS